MYNAEKFDFVGCMPMPLRYTVKNGLEAILQTDPSWMDHRRNYYFPMGGRFSLKSLYQITHIDQFPDMLVSTAFDEVFSRPFLEGYADKGYFKAYQPEFSPSIYMECGLMDPEKKFSLVAVAPLVFLIDHRQLNGLPVPKRWSDILNPAYHNQVVYGGWKQEGSKNYTEYNKALLLYIYKLFGRSGIVALAENVSHLLPNAQIPSIAGTLSEQGAAIYIVPWFQAKICPRREMTSVVWPEDGALALPIYSLLKKNRHADLDSLLSYFTGSQLANYLMDNWYPPVHPLAQSKFSDNTCLKWLGWDYIRSHNIAEVMMMATSIFWEQRRLD